jgi:hypothetical protein
MGFQNAEAFFVEIRLGKTKPQAANIELDALFFLFKYTIPSYLRSSVPRYCLSDKALVNSLILQP